MSENKVLILGSGVAGLTTALELAKFGIPSEIIERAPFAGGHAIGFSCKATDECVRCGACLAEDRLFSAMESEKIRIHPSSRLTALTRDNGKFKASIQKAGEFIDPSRCNGCGRCLEACGSDGAILRGASPYNSPPFAIDMGRCREAGRDCRACMDACPRSAISFEKDALEFGILADAVVVASGFRAFDPIGKPYGYGRFKDVITNLELERMLRENGRALRPSTGSQPSSIAFIQCVGSRDDRLDHLWCSRVCCGSALRMARWIRYMNQEIRVSVFYIDIQNFGRDFPVVWDNLQDDVGFIRTLPGDAVLNQDATIRVNFFDPVGRVGASSDFDLLVLSVGITPGDDLYETARLLGLPLDGNGFLADPEQLEPLAANGVTAAGTVFGPMSILDAVKSAQAASWRTLGYMGIV